MYETPDRVSIDLRRFQANDLPEFSKEDLAEARQELMEELLAGERVGRLDLEAILDEEADKNRAAFIRDLYEHFAGIGNDSRVDEYDRCLRAQKWMERLVSYHLDLHEEIIQERAADIASQRLEDA